MVLSPNMDSSSFARYQTRRAGLFTKRGATTNTGHGTWVAHSWPGIVLQKGNSTLCNLCCVCKALGCEHRVVIPWESLGTCRCVQQPFTAMVTYVHVDYECEWLL